MIRVLLVDDQPIARLGVAAILETDPDIGVIGEASNAQEAITLAKTLKPDVICIDVRMPGTDGIAAVGQLQSLAAPAAVLVLTTSGDDKTLIRSFQVGASGFLLKGVSPEDLIDAIKTVKSGGTLFDSSMAHAVVEIIKSYVRLPSSADPDGPDLLVPEGPGPLTEREIEVLAGMTRGLTNVEIAKELHLGESTVKTHVSNIFSKAGVRDRVQAVLWGLDHRLIHRTPAVARTDPSPD